MNRTVPAARAAFVFALVGAAACQQGGFESAQSAALDTEDQKASYAIGLQVGQSLVPAGDMVDMSAFLRGVQDAMAKRDPVVDPAELQTVMQSFGGRVQQAQQAAQDSIGTANQQEGEAFLAENGAKDGVTTTASGLQYEVLEPGEGPTPGPEDRVRINYRGTLIDGTQFDSSYDRGEPAEFGVGGVIPGFAEALQLMPVGSKYRFYIPSDIAYGANGAGGAVGPNATLIFEVEMLGILE